MATQFEMYPETRQRAIAWAIEHCDDARRVRYVERMGAIAITVDFRDECGDWGTEIMYVTNRDDLNELLGY